MWNLKFDGVLALDGEVLTFSAIVLIVLSRISGLWPEFRNLCPRALVVRGLAEAIAPFWMMSSSSLSLSSSSSSSTSFSLDCSSSSETSSAELCSELQVSGISGRFTLLRTARRLTLRHLWG